MEIGRRLTHSLLWAVLCALPHTARADQEVSNTPIVAAGAFSRCYARSVPNHIYDPFDQPRQQGTTTTYYVTKSGDVPVDTYDWYSHAILVTCTSGANGKISEGGTPLPLIRLVRFGPWQRSPPQKDHLAVAFYADGKLLKSWSTFDIAGGGKPPRKCGWRYENMVFSVSHYEVFGGQEEPRFGEVQIRTPDGPRNTESLILVTVDGRKLFFRTDTGELVKSEKKQSPRNFSTPSNPAELRGTYIQFIRSGIVSDAAWG